MKKGEFDHTILLLQGGGALGAYQAGAYEGLVEADIAPDWVVGISIGGINAALIAGNPPGRRVERLREFWDRVSEHAPLIPPPWMRYDAADVESVEFVGLGFVWRAGFLQSTHAASPYFQSGRHSPRGYELL